VKLLQEQIISNFEEVRKRRVAPNDAVHVFEALVQPPKDIEGEDPVVNECAEVSQTVGHGLELATVRNRTLTLIEREDDTRSWRNFLVYFSHSTTMPCPPRGWGYILIGC
jgi:hypothetical protein